MPHKTRPKPTEAEKKYLEAFKCIPTDTEYFTLRDISVGHSELAPLRNYLLRTTRPQGVKVMSPKHMNDSLGNLEKTGMIEKHGNEFMLTLKGKMLLLATDSIFFDRMPPGKVYRVYESDDYSFGPLSETFKGGKYPRVLYDLMRIHEEQKNTGWAEIHKLGINTVNVSHFFRQGVVETNVPHREIEFDSRSRPVVSLDPKYKGAPVYETGELADSITWLTKEQMNELKFKTAYSRKEKREFKTWLIENKVSGELASLLSRPQEAAVLWSIAKGRGVYREIAEDHRFSVDSVAACMKKLVQKELVTKQKRSIRLKTEKKKTKSILEYLKEIKNIHALPNDKEIIPIAVKELERYKEMNEKEIPISPENAYANICIMAGVPGFFQSVLREHLWQHPKTKELCEAIAA